MRRKGNAVMSDDAKGNAVMNVEAKEIMSMLEDTNK